MKRKLTLILFSVLLSAFAISQNNIFLLHEGAAEDEAECPVGAIFSQPAIFPYSYASSSVEYNVEVFTYFTDVAENIGGMRFWGELIDFETFTQYDPPENFIIRFYTGNIDDVGVLVARFDLLLDGTLLEVNGSYNVWTFDAVFPTPINLFTGWVSVQNTDPVFSFWWRDTQAAPDGKSVYVNHNNGIFYTSMYPKGICLTEGGALPVNDLSVLNILTPETGVNLTNAETVTTTITNYGTAPQSNFDLVLTVNGGTPITETYTGTLNYLESAEYTFNTTIDLSEHGDYAVEVCANLPGDENIDNDCHTKTVTNLVPVLCIPDYIMGCSDGDGFNDFALSNLVNNGTGCENNTGYGGWSQYLEIDTALLEQGKTYALTISSNYDYQYVSAWIDFDDNLILTEEEYVLHNFFMDTAGVQYHPMLEIPNDALLGPHLLRARTQRAFQVNTPCGTLGSGEAEDYIVKVVLPVNIEENILGEINIYPNPATGFISIESENEIGEISVYNTAGQLVNHTNIGDKAYRLNISGWEQGIYYIVAHTIDNPQCIKIIKK